MQLNYVSLQHLAYFAQIRLYGECHEQPLATVQLYYHKNTDIRVQDQFSMQF